MADDLVSVVVPVYNVEKYLNRCIDSIVCQTYSNLEIILVDDGSPDRCPQMCDDWVSRDERIKVIHKVNAGLGMARNTGIENATGDYICFFDSDDYILPQTIENALVLAKNSNAEIVVFGMQNVDRAGQVIRRVIPEAEEFFFSGSSVQTGLLPDLIDGRQRNAAVRNLCLSAWSGLYAMDLVKRTGWRFVSERQNISEDSYSLIWLYQYVKTAAVLPQICYCHCENGASLTRTYREDRYQRICDFYRDCMAMVETAGYGEEVRRSVSGLTLSFAIAAMKQIAAARITAGEKHRLLKQILADDTMRRCLKSVAGRKYSRSRQLLLWAMEYRCNILCHALLAAQNTIRK